MGVSVGSSIYNAPSIYESGQGGGSGGGLQPDEIVIGDQVLQTAQINDQIWTTKNFDTVLTGINYNTGGDFPVGAHCWYYNRDSATYGIYGENRGLLYTAACLSIIQAYIDENLPGWRIPTKDDWQKLINFAGGNTFDSLYKLGAPRLWVDTSNFTNELNLSIIPTGRRMSKKYSDLDVGFYWSSTQRTASSIVCAIFGDSSYPASPDRNQSINYDACAVRFVKDA
jgi:uncharacterized protein (TIGR02145 family)